MPVQSYAPPIALLSPPLLELYPSPGSFLSCHCHRLVLILFETLAHIRITSDADFPMNPISKVVFPAPPPTFNRLSSQQRALLMRKAKKIEQVLGIPPRLVDVCHKETGMSNKLTHMAYINLIGICRSSSHLRNVRYSNFPLCSKLSIVTPFDPLLVNRIK